MWFINKNNTKTFYLCFCAHSASVERVGKGAKDRDKKRVRMPVRNYWRDKGRERGNSRKNYKQSEALFLSSIET